MDRDQTEAQPNHEPPHSHSSVSEETQTLVAQVKAMAEAFRTTMQAMQSAVDSMVTEVKSVLQATQAQLDLLRAQTDVTIDLQANMQDQTEKLGSATVALITVSNNLVELMTEPQDDQDAGS